MHELSPEQKKELKTIAPVREEYLDGGLVVLVGKDTEAAVGMRVRMRDGLISHGVGTITALCSQEEAEAGCCEVVWDSNQSHTRSLHVKLGNKHLCRVGKEGHHDLVLADANMCSDLTIVKHELVLQGRPREYLEVVRNCKEERAVQAQQDQDTDAPGTGRTLMAAAAATTVTKATKPEAAVQAETSGHESQCEDGGAGRKVEDQECEDGT